MSVSKKDLVAIIGKVNNFCESLKVRRGECEENGAHIGPVEDKGAGYVVTSRSNPLRDKVSIQCVYCGTTMERPLNFEERKEISEFRKSLHETILY